MCTEQKIMELTTREEPVSIDELHAVYDKLEPVGLGFMLGQWRGGCFNTGHRGEAMLEQLNWCGKRFHATDDVDPILCNVDGGDAVASDVMGKASLRMVEYRGVVTATMVYDNHPIFDHFKQVSSDLVLGVMDSKGDDTPLYFYLSRQR